MSDLADRAQAQQETLEAARARFGKGMAKVSPQPTGFCLNCGEPLMDMRRWCGVECRDDWERFDAHCQ